MEWITHDLCQTPIHWCLTSVTPTSSTGEETVKWKQGHLSWQRLLCKKDDKKERGRFLFGRCLSIISIPTQVIHTKTLYVYNKLKKLEGGLEYEQGKCSESSWNRARMMEKNGISSEYSLSFVLSKLSASFWRVFSSSSFSRDSTSFWSSGGTSQVCAFLTRLKNWCW